MPNLIGTGPSQVPTNADLGKLAFMDEVVTITNNPYIDTAISDVKPSLLLDFANSKTLDPRINYSRASTGTYYDGKTVAKAEENLLTYSQEFDNAAWLKGAASVTANTTTAPDGSSTADSYIGDGTTSARYLDQVQAANPNGRTYSVYAKAGTNNYIQLAFSGDPTAWANFDLSLGTVGSVGTNQTASIVSVGNGWYRCIVYTSSNTAANIRHFLISSSTAIRSETNSLSTYVYLWGAQLEQRSTVTAYTPTTTQPITNYIPVLQTSAAGVPRFDHDPITGESKGLLIEEQRTNLLTYSEQFDNAAWIKPQTSVLANSVIAPDGTQSADKLVEASDTAQTHYIQPPGTTVTAGTNYATTFYLKAGERTKARVVFNTTGGVFADFDLSTGSLIGSVTAFSGGTATSASITPVGNGWYRCAVIGYGASGTTGYSKVEILDASGNRSYNGNGYSGLYLWGAQLEAGAFPTSYIPTTTSQVTRSADSASMTGSNFSSWYNNAEGTVYVEALQDTSRNSSGTYRHLLALHDSTLSNYTNTLISSGNQIQAQVQWSGAAQASLFSSTNTGSAVKACLGYKANDFALSGNALAASTDSVGNVPSGVDQMTIGATGGAPTASILDGTIKRIAYYPKRLSNDELQEMTE